MFLPSSLDGVTRTADAIRAKRSIISDLNTHLGAPRPRPPAPPRRRLRGRARSRPTTHAPELWTSRPGVADERRRARRISTFKRVAAADRQTSCSARPQTSKLRRKPRVEAQHFHAFISVRDERKELVRRVAHGLGEDEAVLGARRREGVLLRLLDALPQNDPCTVDRDAAAVSTH